MLHLRNMDWSNIDQQTGTQGLQNKMLFDMWVKNFEQVPVTSLLMQTSTISGSKYSI